MTHKSTCLSTSVCLSTLCRLDMVSAQQYRILAATEVELSNIGHHKRHLTPVCQLARLIAAGTSFDFLCTSDRLDPILSSRFPSS